MSAPLALGNDVAAQISYFKAVSAGAYTVPTGAGIGVEPRDELLNYVVRKL
ncbi:hypothetical protein JHL21_01935 [Devosia sp. WQ 349]|uniref:hypothetical protein n=1 Tax=Devosia sp. WQ 349K1 TaxID=2800329 RepID=UPI00190867A1|nr:hypothetical protein [Devosia sp. WQ 349K1]MBK1793253.1 hypothetical protein [Devosia sp. WQ 349K1]